MEITFLLSSTIHVRFIKRVEILKRLVDEIQVYAFVRKGTYPGKKIDFEMNVLGQIRHISYFRRFVLLVKSINKIKRAVKKTSVIYTFGLDMLFLGWLSKKINFDRNIKLLYEVGDIREILIGNALVNKLARYFERFLLRDVTVLIITSHAFYTEYYHRVQRIKSIKYHVLENKLDSEFMSAVQPQEVDEKNNEVITIGYFGVLRCAQTLKVLKMLVEKGQGKIKIYLRGLPGIRTKEAYADLVTTKGVLSEGMYVVPDDLFKMYNVVDMVWACYPFQGEETSNWCWAKTIRFYEACYFNKPVFVQAGTEDCKTVKQYNIGVCLELGNIEKTVNYILSISEDEISNWKKNMEKLPEHVYLYTDEHEQLIKLIAEL